MLTRSILADTMRIATRTEARRYPRLADPYAPRARFRAIPKTTRGTLAD